MREDIYINGVIRTLPVGSFVRVQGTLMKIVGHHSQGITVERVPRWWDKPLAEIKKLVNWIGF
jgi:hypothetical protein